MPIAPPIFVSWPPAKVGENRASHSNRSNVVIVVVRTFGSGLCSMLRMKW